MGTNKINLQHYFRALKEFSLPAAVEGTPSYTQNMERLEQILRSKGVPEVVEYVKNERGKVTLVYQETSGNPTCVEINSDGKIIAKDTYCTREKWSDQIPEQSLAATIFSEAVPGFNFTPQTSGNNYPENAVADIAQGAQNLYDCLLKSVGSNSCNHLVASVNATTSKKQEQKVLEIYRERAETYWRKAHEMLKDAERESDSWFSGIDPKPIQMIISKYSANPYEGSSPVETMRGRAERAEKMFYEIWNSESHQKATQQETARLIRDQQPEKDRRELRLPERDFSGR